MIFNILTDVDFDGYALQGLRNALFWKGGFYQHSLLLTGDLNKASLILDLEAARATARDLTVATGEQFSVVTIKREDARPPEDDHGH